MANTNVFSSSTVVPGVSVTSTVNKTALVDKIQEMGSDVYFDSTSELYSVMITYRHSSGRQKKMISHTGSGLSGNVMWTAGAQDGTWEKWLVEAYDRDGAKAIIHRSDIGASEDLTKSDGTIYLVV